MVFFSFSYQTCGLYLLEQDLFLLLCFLHPDFLLSAFQHRLHYLLNYANLLSVFFLPVLFLQKRQLISSQIRLSVSIILSEVFQQETEGTPSWDFEDNLLKGPFTEVKIGQREPTRNAEALRDQPQFKVITALGLKGTGEEMAWQVLEPSKRSRPTGAVAVKGRSLLQNFLLKQGRSEGRKVHLFLLLTDLLPMPPHWLSPISSERTMGCR